MIYIIIYVICISRIHLGLDDACYILGIWNVGRVGAMPSRLKYQKGVRNTHVKFILGKMFSRLKNKQDMKRIITTNRILPVGTLKRRAVKRVFAGWICELYGEGRILTSTLAKEVCLKLRKKLGLVNSSLEVEEEARRLHLLLKRARKRQVHLVASTASAMSAMDTLDTVPLLEELPFEDWYMKLKVPFWKRQFFWGAGQTWERI